MKAELEDGGDTIYMHLCPHARAASSPTMSCGHITTCYLGVPPLQRSQQSCSLIMSLATSRQSKACYSICHFPKQWFGAISVVHMCLASSNLGLGQCEPDSHFTRLDVFVDANRLQAPTCQSGYQHSQTTIHWIGLLLSATFLHHEVPWSEFEAAESSFMDTMSQPSSQFVSS